MHAPGVLNRPSHPQLALTRGGGAIWTSAYWQIQLQVMEGSHKLWNPMNNTPKPTHITHNYNILLYWNVKQVRGKPTAKALLYTKQEAKKGSKYHHQESRRHATQNNPCMKIHIQNLTSCSLLTHECTKLWIVSHNHMFHTCHQSWWTPKPLA